MPSDYEPCGECGFDHEYEYEEAYRAHTEEMERGNVMANKVEIIGCPSTKGWYYRITVTRPDESSVVVRSAKQYGTQESAVLEGQEFISTKEIKL